MGVASVKKVELYAHKTVVNDVLAVLQKLSCCEITSAASNNSEDTVSVPQMAELDDNISEARYLLRVLEPYYIDEISSIARSFGEKPEYSLQQLKEKAESFDVKARAEEIRSLERSLVEIRSDRSQTEGFQTLLEHLDGVPYPLSLLSSGTEQVSGILGTVAVEKTDDWEQSLSSSLGEDVETFVVPSGPKEKEAWVVAVGLREKESQLLEISSSFGFSRVEVSKELVSTVPEELKRLETSKLSLSAKEDSVEKTMAQKSAELVAVVRQLSDYWTLLSDRYGSLENGESTDEIVLVEAWVPEVEVENLKESLSPYSSLTELNFKDPAEGENPPTLLANKEWSQPFETLTKLYGAPKYGDTDPTPLMAPFFFVFFGMCLGDGGYGLIMVGFFMFFLKKFKKMPSGTKQFFSLFVLSGVAATLVGALTGSWLGDMIDVFPFLTFLKPLKDIPVLLIPMNDPMTFLGISLVFGVFQIFFGMIVAMRDCLKAGDYMGAFADQLGWMVFLTGLLLLGGSAKIPALSGFAKFVTLVGTVALIATQGREKDGIFQKAISGVLSLYNVTAYLGDVLSYSRLLALGLATSAIAMIINMLAGLTSSIPYVGWIFAIVIFLGGHLFSVAVNVLGAFVHSLRLQYVEFFSKFYSGGGRLFQPLKYDTKYIAISENGAQQ